MPATKLDDLIQHEVIADIVSPKIEEKSVFLNSGAIAKVPADLSAGNFIRLPAWNPLAATWEQTPTKDGDELTVQGVATHETRLPVMRRSTAFGAYVTAILSSGQDPNGYVADGLSSSAAKMLDTALVSTVTGAIPASSHVKTQTGSFTTRLMIDPLLSVLGDAYDQIAAIITNSYIMGILIDNNMVTYPVTSDPTETNWNKYARLMGIPLIVTDKAAPRGTTTIYDPVYLVAKSSLYLDFQKELTVTSQHEALKARDVVVGHVAFTSGIMGVDYKADIISPSDTELVKPTNWQVPDCWDMTKIDDRKNIAVVKVEFKRA